MLYTCAEDFFDHVDKIKSAKKLTRADETELAKKMKEGDGTAKAALTDSYLPTLAAYLIRYESEPSLELIYRGIETLEAAVSDFDFLRESQSPNTSFTKFLSARVRQMITRYIADNQKY